MKIEYDPKHDLINIEFISNKAITDSVEFDGIIVDYSEDRSIVSVEIMDVGKRTEDNPLDFIDLKIVKEKVA